ncbi:MAG: hypothetical protein B6D63_06795 [Candidatus Latescibacteria bacterium 4484_7]|nr:MAG: hypothetical protein B6D63_06795 [Candidatus Latescibacteria bacterium 4484_7]
MNFQSRAFSSEDEGKLRKLTFLRLVIATSVIGVAILVLQLEATAISVAALYSLLGVIYFATGSVYLAFNKGVPLRPLIWSQIFIDITVLTFIVHYSGGSGSYFTILYILPIIVGGTYFQLTGGLVAAMTSITVYVIYMLMESNGILSNGGISNAYSAGENFSPLLRGYINMMVFILTGILSGYISKYIQSKREELEDKERELKRVHLDTDSIINNMSSGLIVTNMAGEIISVNPAAKIILGLGDIGELQGKMISDVVPHMHQFVKELDYVLQTGSPKKRHEIELIKSDGTKFPIGVSISLLRSDTGEKRGVIALFQDLTEVNMMRERVRKADRLAAVGELSAAIAHEIRAPLASICGSVEMLSGELDLTGEQKSLMDLIVKESDRLDRIITDFLEFAKMRKPELSAFDIEQCVHEVVLLLNNSAQSRGNINIDVESRVNGLQVYADEEQIKEVFLNIGLNACEAMEGDGNLTITISRFTKREGVDRNPVEHAIVEFANDGPPIPPERIPHIFEPFFTTKETGTGLGLSIASRIIESHGGTIEVENRSDGKTVFSIAMPAYTGANEEDDLKPQEEFISF